MKSLEQANPRTEWVSGYQGLGTYCVMSTGALFGVMEAVSNETVVVAQHVKMLYKCH